MFLLVMLSAFVVFLLEFRVVFGFLSQFFLESLHLTVEDFEVVLIFLLGLLEFLLFDLEVVLEPVLGLLEAILEFDALLLDCEERFFEAFNLVSSCLLLLLEALNFFVLETSRRRRVLVLIMGRKNKGKFIF